jgi:hypothetical protein
MGMKRVLMFLSLVCFLAATSLAHAGYGGGPKDFPKGRLCCVNEVCVMAKSDEDCGKIGGKAVKSCKECEKGQPAKGGSPEKTKQ